MTPIDHDKLVRWLRGLAEAAVTANGSRATFASDMYFEAADAIASLQGEVERLKAALKPFADIPSVSLFPEGGVEMAKHYWAVIGAPDRSHFTQTDLIRARAAISQHPGEGEKA
jgi:hypothetical protein